MFKLYLDSLLLTSNALIQAILRNVFYYKGLNIILVIPIIGVLALFQSSLIP